mgnify:CR=1 FL=1
MKIGVLILNFGEPENPTLDEVIPFLERIFARNSSLESDKGSGRARKLAEARAPGLIEEYKQIGGSPLARQARKQVRMVEGILRRRGLDLQCYSGMQFTEPSVATVVAEAQAAGVEQFSLALLHAQGALGVADSPPLLLIASTRPTEEENPFTKTFLNLEACCSPIH